MIFFSPWTQRARVLTEDLNIGDLTSIWPAQAVSSWMATCPTLRLSSDSKYLTGRAAEDPDSKYFMRGNGNSPLLCPSPTSNILIYGNWKPEDSQSIPSIISHDFKSQSLPILLIWQLGCTFFFFFLVGLGYIYKSTNKLQHLAEKA